MSEKTVAKKRFFSYHFWAIVLIISGLVIGGFYIYLLSNNNILTTKSELDISKIGAFGDFIGGVIGSLWALAGVFLFFQALKEQRQDIETNIQLLQLQIEGLERSKETTERQARILKTQQFETTFFSLLKLFIETTDNLEILHATTENSVGETIKGKSVFKLIAEKLYNSTDDPSPIFLAMYTKTIIAYMRIHDEYEETLQPYFGALYSILKFIDSADLEISEKYTYSNTLRSRLTNSELLILNYHWDCNFGYNFTDVFKKFNFLKNLPISIRPEFKVHKKNLDRILKNTMYVFPPNLFEISQNIDYLLKKEFFERKSSSKSFFTSCLSMWVTIKGNDVEVQIKVPTLSLRKEMLNGMYAPKSDAKILTEFRKFDFCNLIEAIFASIMVNKKFLQYYSIENKRFIYQTKREIYDTHDLDYKVFKCTFTYENEEEMIPPIDYDELLSIVQSVKDQLETSNSLG